MTTTNNAATIRNSVMGKLSSLLESDGPRTSGDVNEPCPAEDLETLSACNNDAWWIAVSKSSPTIWDWANYARRAMRPAVTPRDAAFVRKFGMPIV